MALSINWATKVIFVPLDYLTPLGDDVYQMNASNFRLDLKDLEDSEDGMMFPDTHIHKSETILAGVTYQRFIEITNGYTITFEDGQYAVNVIGANTNFADVMNVNQVSLRTANSAGAVVVSSGSGLSTEEHDKLLSIDPPTILEIEQAVDPRDLAIEGAITMQEVFRHMLAFISGQVTGAGTTEITFKSLDGNVNRIIMTVDDKGNRSQVALDGGDV